MQRSLLVKRGILESRFAFPICQIAREIVRLWAEINDRLARLFLQEIAPFFKSLRIRFEIRSIHPSIGKYYLFISAPFLCNKIFIKYISIWINIRNSATNNNSFDYIISRRPSQRSVCRIWWQNMINLWSEITTIIIKTLISIDIRVKIFNWNCSLLENVDTGIIRLVEASHRSSWVNIEGRLRYPGIISLLFASGDYRRISLTSRID